MGGCLHIEIKCRPWESNPDTVTHPGTNWTQRRLTSLIETNALIQLRQTTVVHYFSLRESEGVCFYPRWFVCLYVCMSVCDHDNYKDCGRICTKFYEKVPRGKGKTKFVFRYDR